MAFSPLTIDTAAAAAPADSVAPVYVYGASGRCWKFKDPSKVDAYFNKLRGRSDPIFYEWLIKTHGLTIIDRLFLFRRDCNNQKIIATPCEYDVTVTNSDGTTTHLNPSKWKHYSPASNIAFIMTIDRPYNDDFMYNTYMHQFCAKFLNEPENARKKQSGNELIQGAMYMNADFMDYWRGDRIQHTAPRPAPTPPAPAPPTPATQTQPQVPVVEESACYPFLRFRGRHRVQDAPSVKAPPKETTAFLPLMIEVD
jgi:hypothetical protein